MKGDLTKLAKTPQGALDIEGSIFGLEQGIKGESKYKLESAINLADYLKRNLEYFKELETKRKQE